MQTSYTTFNPYLLGRNGLEKIKRLTVKETAALLGMRAPDLYNAYSRGLVGGYIQRDKETANLYVLESDVHKIRELLAQRAASPVKRYTFAAEEERRKILDEKNARLSKIAKENWAKRKAEMQENEGMYSLCAASLKMGKSSNYIANLISLGKLPDDVQPKQIGGRTFLTEADIKKIIELQAKRRAERQKKSGQIMRERHAKEKLKAEPVTVIAQAAERTPQAADRQDIAIELIKAGFADAGVYLLTGKQ